MIIRSPSRLARRYVKIVDANPSSKRKINRIFLARLEIGNQAFTISPSEMSANEAKFFKRMLGKAMHRLIERETT